MSDLNLEGLTDAQLRLFAVRCARRVQRLMTDPRSIKALDVAERHARGEATDKELSTAWAAAWDAADALWAAAAKTWDAASAASWAAASAAAYAARAAAAKTWDAASAAACDAACDAAWAEARAAAWDAERAEQQKILDKIREVKP